MRKSFNLLCTVPLLSLLLPITGNAQPSPALSTVQTHGMWAWEDGGSNFNTTGTMPCGYGPGSLGAPGHYGTLGVPSPSNTPGSRRSAIHWTDPAGNFWLFGGFGFNALGQCGFLNDLWRFDPSSLEWTWMSGSSTPAYFSSGVYGAKTKFAAPNTPGSRELAVTWLDRQGNLWLFGGDGYDSTGAYGTLNDVWEFNPTTRQWAWVAGSTLVNQAGDYGTMRVPGPHRTPGARWGAAAWTDHNGNFWLFGGFAWDSQGQDDTINDLWEFNPSTRQWAWMGGSHVPEHNGVYGTKGVASLKNVPGARESASTWVDPSGNLWLFGGFGFAAYSSQAGYLNDLWKYSPATLEWTYVSGKSAPGDEFAPPWIGDSGVYGSPYVPGSGNLPGSRVDSATWVDASGNLWLLGGLGYDSVGASGALNDLWEYFPSTNKWAWMGGRKTTPYGTSSPGVYGKYRTAGAGNLPGARNPAAWWTDRTGHLWLFGGEGFDSSGIENLLNDLWVYRLP